VPLRQKSQGPKHHAERVDAELRPLCSFCTEPGVLICDKAFRDPDALVEIATRASFISAHPSYPGIRASVPTSYKDELLSIVSNEMRVRFAHVPVRCELAAFSITSTAPGELQDRQCIPHFDGIEEDRFAFVHYLFHGTNQGTSFYRHEESGVSCISPDNVHIYRQALEKMQHEFSSAQGYINGDEKGFIRIKRIASIYNRLIIYPGNVLHSGDIDITHGLSTDLSRGRLTVTGFIRTSNQLQ